MKQLKAQSASYIGEEVPCGAVLTAYCTCTRVCTSVRSSRSDLDGRMEKQPHLHSQHKVLLRQGDGRLFVSDCKAHRHWYHHAQAQLSFTGKSFGFCRIWTPAELEIFKIPRGVARGSNIEALIEFYSHTGVHRAGHTSRENDSLALYRSS